MALSTVSYTEELSTELAKLNVRALAQNIMKASERSEQAIVHARSSLIESPQMGGYAADLVAFGSLARHELTPSSDLDYLFLGDSLYDDPQIQKAIIDKLRTELIEGVTLATPGTTGLFGGRINISELIEHVGLQEDTNHSLTRRILFLEESVSLFNPDIHHEALNSILNKYLEARQSRSEKIPRFLLNDIIRYWRTIAVDYHAKTQSGRASRQTPYSLRYLKLLISRKLCFIASIAPLYLLSVQQQPVDELEFLSTSFQEPAVLRLVKLLNHVSISADPGVVISSQGVVKILDHFIDCSGDPLWRRAVEAECLEGNPKESKHFGEMRTRGKDLHGYIGDILTSKAMLQFTKEYMLS